MQIKIDHFAQTFLKDLQLVWIIFNFLFQKIFLLFIKKNIFLIHFPVNSNFKYVIRMELDSTKEMCTVPILEMQNDKN